MLVALSLVRSVRLTPSSRFVVIDAYRIQEFSFRQRYYMGIQSIMKATWFNLLHSLVKYSEESGADCASFEHSATRAYADCHRVLLWSVSRTKSRAVQILDRIPSKLRWIPLFGAK